MKISELVDHLCDDLGITQKHLASLIDVSGEAIARSKNETFDPTAKTKVMRRLDSLVFAIYPLLQEPISPITRLSVLKTLAYPDIHGDFDSVVSALKQDKYQKELLRIIAEAAFKKIKEQKK